MTYGPPHPTTPATKLTQQCTTSSRFLKTTMSVKNIPQVALPQFHGNLPNLCTIAPHATSQNKPCTTLLALDSQTRPSTLSPAHSPSMPTSMPRSLTLTNTVAASSILSPRNHHAVQEVDEGATTQESVDQGHEQKLHRLVQGWPGITKGTITIFYLSHAEILSIPKDRTVTYGRNVIDHRPQKEDPHHVRIITVGGNLIKYPFELTTCTADMLSSKIMWNSVISTPDA